MYKFCSQEMQRRVSQILPKHISASVESMSFSQTRECLIGHKAWLDGEIKTIRAKRPRNGIEQIKALGQKIADIMLCISELNARIRAENPIPDDIAFKIAAGKILPQATIDTITGLARTIQKEYQDRAAKDVAQYD